MDRGRRAVMPALALLFVPAAIGAATGEPSASPPTFTAPPITTQAEMERAFDEFFTVGLDLERPLAVRDFKIKRDTFEMTFAQGTVYLAKPVAGQVTGAYFAGTGTMKLSIPNTFDRKEMQETYGKAAIEESISEAVLRFDDGAEQEILAAGKPGGPISADPMTTWNERLKVDFNSIDLQMDFLETRLNALKHTTFFMAAMRLGAGKTWYAFVHSGGDRIENGLYHERLLGAAGKRWYVVICQFHRPEDYDAKGNYDLMPESDAKDIATVRHTEMTIEIPNTKSVLIDARLTVEALRDGVRALRFDFVNNIDAASWTEKGRPVTPTLVADTAGNALPYLHRWHQLMVLLPRPLTKGETTVVQVKATEDTINQLTSRSYWIYTDDDWFPKMGYGGGRYTMDWTVKIAKPLRAAGTGDLVKEWVEGDLNCGRWKSDVPVELASFIFGDFKSTDGLYKRESPGTGEVPLRLFTIQGGAEHFKGNPQNVLTNIAQGIKTYETILGPFPYAQLDIAEMAKFLEFAQAPAGILLVSSVVAGGTIVQDEAGVRVLNIEEQGGLGKVGGGGVGDQFVYHELAHQWWGHQVDGVGPEDIWISESWAEYSAGLIIDAIDPKRFRDMRVKWKKHAIDGDPFGTISAAYRSDSPEHPGTYWRMVYNKGPYVVHMLRTWMGWEKFSKYVSTIQSKYKGTDINTDTLAREASVLMGYDMFPFFDQWVRDKGIPKVRYSWSSAPEADGKHLVTIKVRQEDEANFKILMVPIQFIFGKGDPVVVTKPILKPSTELQVRVPVAPKDVRMDPDETQLATILPEPKR